LWRITEDAPRVALELCRFLGNAVAREGEAVTGATCCRCQWVANFEISM
jgi:hypothetical protein